MFFFGSRFMPAICRNSHCPRLRDLDFEAKERPGLWRSTIASILLNFCQKHDLDLKQQKVPWRAIDFFWKVGPRSFQVLFWQRLSRVGDRKKEGEPPYAYETPKNQQENLSLSMIPNGCKELLPIFAESMQMFIAKKQPSKNRQKTRPMNSSYRKNHCGLTHKEWELHSEMLTSFIHLWEMVSKSTYHMSCDIYYLHHI